MVEQFERLDERFAVETELHDRIVGRHRQRDLEVVSAVGFDRQLQVEPCAGLRAAPDELRVAAPAIGAKAAHLLMADTYHSDGRHLQFFAFQGTVFASIGYCGPRSTLDVGPSYGVG